MAELRAEGDSIVVSLTPVEKLATFRFRLSIPRSAVSSAAPIHTPFQTIRGIRSPGILIPPRSPPASGDTKKARTCFSSIANTTRRSRSS